MNTVGELLTSLEVAIEKVKNSQEYRSATMGNRYALLKDLENSQRELEAMVTSASDLQLTRVELKIKNNTRSRTNVVFS